MGATTGLMTVGEFAALPEPPGGYHELRNGEVVVLSHPPRIHQDIQRLIIRVIEKLLGAAGHVGVEAFRPTPEHNVWVADVGFTTRERWRQVGRREWLSGSPDIVVEIISPSNTVPEMNERERTCLSSGCRQFWTVDPDLEIVKVATPNGLTVTCDKSGRIDLAEFGGGIVNVADIFASE